MVSRFEGKVVLVARAGTEIGAATARRFHAEGANVVLAGRREAELMALANSLGDRHLVRLTDVRATEQVDKLVAEAMSRFGAIDVLVNLAAPMVIENVLDKPQEHWMDVFAASMGGVFNLADAILAVMTKAGRGVIVNVSASSRVGDDVVDGAVHDLTHGLAMQFAWRGIRANSVCPGVPSNELRPPILDQDPELLRRVLQHIPGRTTLAEKVAGVIAFLASDEAGYINGEHLHVDAGARFLNRGV
jgi:meso-butanediol dehydrogenase / (S,S)-butanediol dehydrogenase / diacetyl reductase